MSALWLGVLLPALSSRVGLPTDLLHGLAGVALLLVVAGPLAGWLAGPRRTLAGLAVGNAGYAVLTSVLLVMQRDALQWLGWIYFVLEIAILIWLVRLEWRVYVRLREQGSARSHPDRARVVR